MSNIVKFLSSWELAWNVPLKEMDLWEFPLREFDVNGLIMFPVTGIQNNFVAEYHNFEDAVAANPNLVKVFVDENGEENLRDFVHPENALYIIGKTSLSLETAYRQPGDKSITISTKNSTGLFWGHQVASIIMYDRNNKEGI
jgi:hypothetical protein